MTTNKPEVVAYVDLYRGHGRRYVSLRRGVDHYSLNDGDALIRLTDYKALRAECDALVEALEQVIKAAPSSGPLWYGSEQIVEARAALAKATGETQ